MNTVTDHPTRPAAAPARATSRPTPLRLTTRGEKIERVACLVILATLAIAISMVAVLLGRSLYHSTQAECTGQQTVKVVTGDTLEQLIKNDVAGSNNVDWRDIAADVAGHNHGSSKLAAGQKITLPASCG